MKAETEKVLNNLKQFCLENKCSFVRSDNSSNDLVLSVKIEPYTFEEVYFTEEISFEALEYEWYTI